MPPSSPATALARSNVRFTTMSVPVPCARSCARRQLAHRRPRRSGAPSCPGSGRRSPSRARRRRSRRRRARAAMPVSLRTRFAAENDLWNARWRTRPDAPIAAAIWYCSFSCPQNLRLADDHRVEARGDAEEMPDRLAAAVRVEPVADRLGRDAVLGARGTTAAPRRPASPDAPQASTSTRLQVDTITHFVDARAARRARGAPARSGRCRTRAARAPPRGRCDARARRGRFPVPRAFPTPSQ